MAGKSDRHDRRAADLIDRAQSGDETATRELIAECERAILRGMASVGVTVRSPDFDDAANASQHKIYTGVAKFKHESHICGWMGRIARNTAAEFVRRAGRRTALHKRMRENAPILTQPEPTIEERYDIQELSALVIDALPDIYRDVVLPYYFGDEPVADMAKRLHISVSTVHARLHRARKFADALIRRTMR